MQETQQTLKALQAQLDFIDKIFERYDRAKITEVMVNDDGKIWIDYSGSFIEIKHTITSNQLVAIIDLLAGYCGVVCDDKNPQLSAYLPLFGGGRFQALRQPVVDSPIISLRLPSKVSLSLEDLASKGTLTLTQAEQLQTCIHQKKNIIVAGGTGSGKTTLTSALANTIQGERVLVIEDNRELKLLNENTNYILTNKHFTLSDAVVASLRLRPDRIFVGEIRDGLTALGLCEGWLTGHPGGLATIHANSAKGVYERLAELCGRVTTNIPHQLIRDTLDVVVFIEKVVSEDGSVKRMVTEIKEKV